METRSSIPAQLPQYDDQDGFGAYGQAQRIGRSEKRKYVFHEKIVIPKPYGINGTFDS